MNNLMISNNINSRERNYWLDNTKFLLILLVVVGHFISSFRKYELVNHFYYFILLFHMPLFIFITGFFSKNVVTKNKSKILNFLVLYILMQIIEILITKEKFSIVKPAYALWYLQSIIIYNLLLPTIHKMKPVAICIISIAIGLIIGFDNNANTIASLSRTFVMLPFFTMGYFITEAQLNKLKSRKNIILAIIFLILIIMLIPILINEPINTPRKLLWASESYNKLKLGTIGVLYRAVWYILSTLTSLSVLTLVPKIKLPLISKFGTRTLQVYCLHIIVVLIVKESQLYKSIDTKLELICLFLSSVFLTFLLSLKIFSYPFNFIMNSKMKLIMQTDESKNTKKYKHKNNMKN